MAKSMITFGSIEDFDPAELRDVSLRLINFYDVRTDSVITRLDAMQHGVQIGLLVFGAGHSNLDVPKGGGVISGSATMVNGKRLVKELEKMLESLKTNGFAE